MKLSSAAMHLHAKRQVLPHGRRGLHAVGPAQLHSQRLVPSAPALQAAQEQRCDVYDGAELRAATRPGAEDHRQWPSRIGNELHYLDGRVVQGGAA
jgi:hypothetical protein